MEFVLHLLVANLAQVVLLIVGLAFKDDDEQAAFPLSPIEILWANLVTSSFLALGLGMEEAQENIMSRPPYDARTSIFTWELVSDQFVYGLAMGGLCLLAFSIVAFLVPSWVFSVAWAAQEVDSGEERERWRLGAGCNQEWDEACEIVFRARSTTYATLSVLLLVAAWEAKHLRRSLFSTNLWANQSLFFAVVFGLLAIFPIIYIPVLNHVVFKHHPISWEWGIVGACLVAYIAAVELWKGHKRHKRHRARRLGERSGGRER